MKKLKTMSRERRDEVSSELSNLILGSPSLKKLLTTNMYDLDLYSHVLSEIIDSLDNIKGVKAIKPKNSDDNILYFSREELQILIEIDGLQYVTTIKFNLSKGEIFSVSFRRRISEEERHERYTELSTGFAVIRDGEKRILLEIIDGDITALKRNQLVRKDKVDISADDGDEESVKSAIKVLFILNNNAFDD